MTSLISPSKITAWLDCAHTLTLHQRVESRQLTITHGGLGEMAQMLMNKGQSHEDAVLARFESDGRSIHQVPTRISPDNPQPADAGGLTADDFNGGWEPFDSWVVRVGNPMADHWDVIYQLPMIHDGVRGVADFLIRVEASGDVPEHYEAVDAKLARLEAKPGHVLQLCFYADALEALTGHRGEHIHLELGSGARETIRLGDVDPYWRRLRGSLKHAISAAAHETTTAEKCGHCEFCEFGQVCTDEWRAADSLVFLAGARTTERAALVENKITTIAELAGLKHSIADIDDQRVDRIVNQARLQVAFRDQPEGSKPCFEELAGFAALPEPNAGDVFLDFEGHPFWTPEQGLFFLFGLIQRSAESLWASPTSGVDSPDVEWEYVSYWAHDLTEQATATHALVDHLVARRARFAGMHVYHYNHTERSSLERLTREFGVSEVALDDLVESGTFVDVFAIVTGALQLGTESYGLKDVERLTDYVRSHDIIEGAGAVVQYERWMGEPNRDERDHTILDRIARYNADDVRATRAVRDWLVEHRPAGSEWRAAVVDPVVSDVELDERVDALHAFGVDTAEHLMGDLLGYWKREKRAVAVEAYRLSIADDIDQIESRSAIAALTFCGIEDQFSEKTGKKLKWPAAVFTYPPQAVDADVSVGSDMIVALNEQEWVFFKIDAIDHEARELKLKWDDTAQQSGVIPTSLAHYNWFREGAKLDALVVLADEMLGRGDVGAVRVGHALLRRDLPTFAVGQGPVGGVFTPSVEAVCAWARQLDGGPSGNVVPIQGPPGTGKTFTGAHLIQALVDAGMRVGVTATSHHAIDNLTSAVVKRFSEDRDKRLKAVRKAKAGRIQGIEYLDDNAKVAGGDFNVVAGTPWLFASKAMREHPVDVLVVDEAGQLGLADTLAASISAKHVILLGDPQQLPQVSQASHPGGSGAGGSGASALEHLLDGEPTIGADRGVFLDTTWRMHSDIAGFISDVMYEGRLGVHPSCDLQTTAASGTGLRWMRAEHTGNSTRSEVEAHLIAEEIKRLMNTDWTDQDGIVERLRPKDFMVVAPYNDQVRLIRDVFSTHKRLAKVEVGTVDKFQGREAAVVLFSMTTSSSGHMPRNADFLFSKNRLNVAISRARCLAYLVCTDDLLATRAKSVDDMKMIGALCAFVERAGD